MMTVVVFVDEIFEGWICFYSHMHQNIFILVLSWLAAKISCNKRFRKMPWSCL